VSFVSVDESRPTLVGLQTTGKLKIETFLDLLKRKRSFDYFRDILYPNAFEFFVQSGGEGFENDLEEDEDDEDDEDDDDEDDEDDDDNENEEDDENDDEDEE